MIRHMAFRLTVAVALGAGLCTPSAICAEPASSPQSAWSDVSLKPGAGSKDPLVNRGKEVFDARCRACHGDYPKSNAPASNSLYALPPMAGTVALEARYKGSKPALLEQRTDLTPAQVTFFVRRGSGIMAPFRPTEVSNDDLTALGAYLARKR